MARHEDCPGWNGFRTQFRRVGTIPLAVKQRVAAVSAWEWLSGDDPLRSDWETHQRLMRDGVHEQEPD